jgi:NAD(P)-dependent dehydrogenase (short-subunit alcohol dehydrogenase family)
MRNDRAELFSVEKKHVVITGGAGGIGKVLADAFASASAYTALVDLREAETQAAARQLTEAYGTGHLGFGADITKKDEVEACVEQITAAMGSIDVLVNCAGMNIREDILDITEDHWDRILSVNLKGAFLFAQAVGRKMVAAGSGRIINMASISSILGHPQRGAYAASKGGMVQMTKVMAIEWAQHNVLVNAVSPAAIYTPLIDGRIDTKEKESSLISEIPLGRIGDPEDLIGPVLFLASRASGFVTGTNLIVDGGRTID